MTWVKSLVVAQEFPWPSDTGAMYRLAKVVETMTRLGEVDLFAFTHPNRDGPRLVPPGLLVRRLKVATAPVPDPSVSRHIRWGRKSGRPPDLNKSAAVSIRSDFDAWVDGRYDFVWFSRMGTFEWLGRPQVGPTVVDLDDLEDSKIRLHLSNVLVGGSQNPRERLHHRVTSVKERLRAWRWQGRQASVAAQVDRVIVCSEHDRARLALTNVTVIPNGFDAPSRPRGRDEVSSSPTLLLPGFFWYGPNSDAATWLATAIAPRVRMKVPGARVRLVGLVPPWLARLDDPPAFTVVGHVDSMEPELCSADLVAVPIRFGSGTRVKILEAFAHRIPVVSTTLGAEGLGAEDGRHLLLSDDADGFAANCVRLLEEPDLRRALVEAAHSLFLERHQWSYACEDIRALALEVAGTGGVPEGTPV